METGRNDLIFAFANTTSYPGYGYFIEQNFTTWPERWGSAGGAASHDSKMHGCYNGIGLWFVEGIAGIRVHFSEVYPVTIRAGVDAGDISAAQGQRVALHGLAKSAWAATATGFVHNITMPQNGVAKVLIPLGASGASGVTESGTAVAGANGVTVLGGTETINRVEYVALEVRGGSYSFRSDWIKS